MTFVKLKPKNVAMVEAIQTSEGDFIVAKGGVPTKISKADVEKEFEVIQVA